MSGFPAERFGIGGPRQNCERTGGGIWSSLIRRLSSTVRRGVHPIEPPVGVDWVIVNGVPVVDEGNLTGALPGARSET